MGYGNTPPDDRGNRALEQTMVHSVYRPCTLCEAHCGLRFDVEDNHVVSVRADEDDVLSKGFICPKGTAFGEVHTAVEAMKRGARDYICKPLIFDELIFKLKRLVADLALDKQILQDAVSGKF